MFKNKKLCHCKIIVVLKYYLCSLNEIKLECCVIYKINNRNNKNMTKLLGKIKFNKIKKSGRHLRIE
jgi:hypothetical protein